MKRERNYFYELIAQGAGQISLLDNDYTRQKLIGYSELKFLQPEECVFYKVKNDTEMKFRRSAYGIYTKAITLGCAKDISDTLKEGLLTIINFIVEEQLIEGLSKEERAKIREGLSSDKYTDEEAVGQLVGMLEVYNCTVESGRLDTNTFEREIRQYINSKTSKGVNKVSAF